MANFKTRNVVTCLVVCQSAAVLMIYTGHEHAASGQNESPDENMTLVLLRFNVLRSKNSYGTTRANVMAHKTQCSPLSLTAPLSNRNCNMPTSCETFRSTLCVAAAQICAFHGRSPWSEQSLLKTESSGSFLPICPLRDQEFGRLQGP
eukprot:2392355-Pleurochrysis_carterae.AAC.2